MRLGRIAGPVAVTGIGAVSGWGWGTEALWEGLLSGRTAIGPPRSFDTRGQRTHVAAEAPEAPREVAAPFATWPRWSRAERFAVAAAREALLRADLEELPARTGVFFGGSTAGMAEAESFFAGLLAERADPTRRDPRARLRGVAAQPIDVPGDTVARTFGVRGPVETVSSACAAGGLAIGAALDALRRGEVEVAIAGGADALCLLTYSGFNSLRAVAERPCNPFRASRAGLSLGEGGGILVLEPLDAALGRGAEPLAELLGIGASCDAHHMTAPHPEGHGAALAVERALRDAGLDPEDVAFVNAHGTGTPLNDVAEWKAIRSALGERADQVPLTSTKGSVGHFLGSSGAVEAVATVLCLLAGVVHPTPGDGPRDPALGADLVVDLPRPLPAGAVAVSTSLAFGGANAALVLRGRPEAAFAQLLSSAASIAAGAGAAA